MTDQTCPGRCCAAFYHRRPHSDLDNDRAWAATASPDELAEYGDDWRQVLDMVVPLTIGEADERLQRLFGLTIDWQGHDGHIYTCRHWDETTRLCTIYDERPGMCRDYPYERSCDHGCGYCAPADVREKWEQIRANQAQEATA